MAIKGYWKLDGNANDASGNGYSGTASNVTYGAGVGGQSGIFNGTTAGIRLSGLGTYSKDTVYSWSAWAYDESNDNNPYCLFANVTNGSYVWNSFIRLYNRYIEGYIYAYNAGPYTDTINMPNMAINKWYFVTLTLDGTNDILKLYVNSKLIGQLTYSASLNTSDNTGGRASIGIYDDTNNAPYWLWKGKIDDVKLYTHIVTPAYQKNEYSRIKGFF